MEAHGLPEGTARACETYANKYIRLNYSPASEGVSVFGDLRLMLASGALGFCYGAGLTFLGFLAAGFGHGAYVVMGLSSAPCGLVQNVPFALAGTLVLWPLAGFLAGGARHWAWRTMFLLILSAHYLSLFRVLEKPSEFADWSYVPRVLSVFVVAVAFYGLGQAALWGLAICRTYRGFTRPPTVGGGE